MAVLGLHCWAGFIAGKWGLLSIAVHGLLTVVAALIAGHGL